MASEAFVSFRVFFFFNDTATTEIYTLSLHDALPISPCGAGGWARSRPAHMRARGDRKSTRLNSSHPSISYAVFCLKKKKNPQHPHSWEKKIETRKPHSRQSYNT